MHPASPIMPPVANHSASRALIDTTRAGRLLPLALILAAWMLLWNKLSVDWSTNEQYEYGWFIPPLALALLAMRWADRPAPGVGPVIPGWAIAGLGAGLLCLLLPVRLIEEPSPDWRVILWLHALALAGLSLCLATWCGGLRWTWHFAFPILFLLLAVPWPSGPEQVIVQSLMRRVAAIAAGIMNLLGIPAVPQGNLIHVRDQFVGVDEACSGIRSLQTTLMGGFLLGELSRLPWSRRALLLGLAITFAMIANVFRSSLLVWITARHGSAVMEHYHDTAGVTVLLIVFAGLLGFNALLSRGAAATAPEGDPAAGVAASVSAVRQPRAVPVWFLAAACAWLILIEVGTACWYRVGNSLGDSSRQRWTVTLPPDAPGLKSVKIDARTRQLLRFDEGLSASWRTPDIPAAECTLFFFRWEAGHASQAQAEIHQPHICLTASGLTETEDRGVSPVKLSNGITLPVRQYSFILHGHPLFVFFVVWEDGVVNQPRPGDATSRWDRLRAVAERRPNLGRQTLEFIVTGQSTPPRAAALFAQDMARLVRPL